MGRYLIEEYERDIGGEVANVAFTASLIFPDGRRTSNLDTDRTLIPQDILDRLFVPESRINGCDPLVRVRRMRVSLIAKNLVSVTSTGLLKPNDSLEFEFPFPFRSPDRKFWDRIEEHFDNVDSNFYYLIGEKNTNYKLIETNI